MKFSKQNVEFFEKFYKQIRQISALEQEKNWQEVETNFCKQCFGESKKTQKLSRSTMALENRKI